MNELWRIVLDHHLYIIVPLFVGVWVWSDWARWNARFNRWRLKRALGGRGSRGPSAVRAVGGGETARSGLRPASAADLSGDLAQLERERQGITRRIGALETSGSNSARSASQHQAGRSRRGMRKRPDQAPPAVTTDSPAGSPR